MNLYSLKLEIQKLSASNSELKEKVDKGYNLLSEKIDELQNNKCQQDIISDDMNNRSITETDSEIICLGPVKVHKEALDAVECRKKHSIFVKELALLFWNEDELIARSVTGRRAPNSKPEKIPKPPLTPSKLIALKEVFTKRLKNLHHSEYMIELEMRHVNKYLAEKINDLTKCKAKKRLDFLEKAHESNSTKVNRSSSDTNSPSTMDENANATTVGDINGTPDH